MSTLSPLQPQDAPDGTSTPKSRMRVTVLTILALHVVFIGGLLMQGCDKKSGTNTAQNGLDGSSLPSLGDTNYFKTYPGDTPGVAAGLGTPAPSTAGIPPVGADSSPSGYATGTGAVAASDLAVGTPGETGVGAGTSIGSLPRASSVTEATTLAVVLAGGTTEHVIARGDTIGGLAKKYGVTTQAIIDANPNAKPRSLQLNDTLLIPPPAPPTSTSVASSGGTAEGEVYVVKQGDNLSKIAKKFGVTVKAIRTANNLKNDRILPKQRLTIPTKAGVKDPASATGQAF